MNEFGQSPTFEKQLINKFEKMELEEVNNFVELAKVKIEEHAKASRCVDGRYEGDDNLPMIAKPGGDAGDALVVLAALNKLGKSISMEKADKIVADFYGGASKFQFHTDEHAEHDHAGVGMGCGHLKLAKNNYKDYGLTADQADELCSSLEVLVSSGAQPIVLKGDHVERAVLVVESEGYGLKPLIRVGEEIIETFVYQKSWHEKQLSGLAKAVVEDFESNELSEDSLLEVFKNAFQVQLEQTLNYLAKGKPVYLVRIGLDGHTEVVPA